MPAIRLPRTRWARALVAAALLGTALTIAPYTWVQAAGDDHTTDDVPSAPVAIVLGAGIYPDGTPQPYLRVRLEAAKDLYDAGKVDAILVSGDHGTHEHDEVAAMTGWLTDRGVPADKVVGDHAGFDTNDSCIRAARIFGVDEAIVITQDFALARAVFLCEHAGITTYGVGVPATDRKDRAYRIREVPAALKASFDVMVGSDPKYLGRYERSLDEALAAD
ncbi:SanA/YdcF family protein [Nocardioides speluncae]|uniref:SanA/YdcF family protein n=1 Tax=Nocardioides speluncae TaxID=2670337 RepID=UPI000D692C52|nr:ElyC/SanA/YdcF family protein [Nocardioides speluncae]